ncbi:CGNR zinc finger domain-containing protein [Streptomyces sp. TRM64462]|uniref:CGNR zinc finger domain-containing protein n=1 Tax=Streptomyces sp. TRM64462 TaxID=2741726 RepID=UPI0028160324|nr:CGNR zinc finger domain-containing protein [Streptomyces sp. TRM64462]
MRDASAGALTAAARNWRAAAAARTPGGVCGASGCGRVYLALGSGVPQRYCSRRCATRVRVAAHRRAKAAG